MERKFKFLTLVLAILLLTRLAWAAAEDDLKVIETTPETSTKEQSQPKLARAESLPNTSYTDLTKYTLGPDDVIEITVMRHPEFSGVYPVNLEGKIQYKFVGDMDINGLTKKELEQKIKEVISNYVISPDVNVTIVEYKSKVIYVLGEVGAPGKYYMRSETMPVRDAVVQAGLPTLAAAMRRCRLVTPDKNNRVKTKSVDLYSILYGGNLKLNIDMRPGDVLYVPSTVMAKIMRVISPVTAPVSEAAGGKGSAATLTNKPIY
jgi:polysaccharide export outer membrane protein